MLAQEDLNPGTFAYIYLEGSYDHRIPGKRTLAKAVQSFIPDIRKEQLYPDHTGLKYHATLSQKKKNKKNTLSYHLVFRKKNNASCYC